MSTNECCKNMNHACSEEKKCGPTIIKQYYGCGCCGNGTDSTSESGNGHSPYIGENGNWFEWSETENDFVDTGIRAEGKDGLIGSDGHSPHIGENGNWLEWSETENDFVDTGIRAEGKDGLIGSDGRSPYIGENGNWLEWSETENAFVDTGIRAEGPKGEEGKMGPQGNDGNGIGVKVEFATIKAANGAPAVSGTPTDGYNFKVVGALANSYYTYHLEFPTKYNPLTDIMDLQCNMNSIWATHMANPFVSSSTTTCYGIGVASNDASATQPENPMVFIGRNGIINNSPWSSSDRIFRVVKRTFG